MSQEIDVTTWAEFEDKIIEIRRGHTSRFFPLLFRGHSDSRWSLDTTLERSKNNEMRFDEYYRIISSMRLDIETFTDTSWSIPEYPKVTALVEEYGKFSLELNFGRNPAYEYMAYIRHHGFPSPLLDWTRSQYIAGYFAFSKADDSGSVSIYVLSEADFHSGSNGVPRVYRLGPNVKVHRRHVLQQSEYTMCLIFNSENEWRFAKHDDVLHSSNEIVGGVKWNFDLTKINIPSKERERVLSSLDEHNLNAFSLFGSEESLMETMQFRKLKL
jgi:FRG domain